MADFGKLNFAVSFNPQTAFPLDARYYFSTLGAAQAAAAAAVEVGSSDGVYFYGENVCVVTDSAADLYIIQPDCTFCGKRMPAVRENRRPCGCGGRASRTALPGWCGRTHCAAVLQTR